MYLVWNQFFFIYSEVVLGEHNTETDPDCSTRGCSPKALRRTPTKIIIHENYDPKEIHNDIGLIRLDQSIGYSGLH